MNPYENFLWLFWAFLILASIVAIRFTFTVLVQVTGKENRGMVSFSRYAMALFTWAFTVVAPLAFTYFIVRELQNYNPAGAVVEVCFFMWIIVVAMASIGSYFIKEQVGIDIKEEMNVFFWRFMTALGVFLLFPILIILAGCVVALFVSDRLVYDEEYWEYIRKHNYYADW